MNTLLHDTAMMIENATEHMIGNGMAHEAWRIRGYCDWVLWSDNNAHEVPLWARDAYVSGVREAQGER